MFAEEEDEEVIGAVRYPCMPSLVALQHMRNRLHLAHLGRKLMKWTTLATGRELRKIATEMHKVYGDSFGEDVRNAFLLLARSRYFIPEMNKMVLTNIEPKASVVVSGKGKQVSAVKCMTYEIFETGIEPYEHLGIEKGGQQLHETKLAWLDLLRRIIRMVELRANFELVEKAHRNATKRLNVLSKVVVPRTHATMAYINSELEEMGREDFFRLKKILEIKRRMYKECHHSTPVKGCDKCLLKEEVDSCNSLTCPPESKSLSETESAKIEPIKEDDIQLSEIKPIKKTKLSEIKPSKSVSYDILEELKTHIDNLIKAKEDLKKIEKCKCTSFLTTANELTDKIIDISQGDAKDEADKLAAEKLAAEKLLQEQLGVFETEYIQTTKILKVKTSDGDVVEEKKVIKTKKERKNPVITQDSKNNSEGKLMFHSSGTSSKSTPYGSGSRTVGMVTIKDRSKLKSRTSVDRKTKSENLIYVSSIACPVARYCMSSASMISSNNNVEFCCTSYSDNNDDYSELVLSEIHVSSLEVDETIRENYANHNKPHLKSD